MLEIIWGVIACALGFAVGEFMVRLITGTQSAGIIEVFLGHLPEADILKAICSRIVFAIEHKQVFLLKVAQKVGVLKVSLSKVEVAERREGQRLLWTTALPETDGLGDDTRLGKLLNLRVVGNTQNLLGDASTATL